MKKEYISPNALLVGLSMCDVITFSKLEIARDIGDNPDGNAQFID